MGTGTDETNGELEEGRRRHGWEDNRRAFLQYIIGWFSNRTGTTVGDGQARGKDETRLPVPNLPLCHWSSQLFDLRAPLSTDVPVLLLNLPISVWTAVSSDVIQRRHKLWAYCTHPANDVINVWKLATPPGSTPPTFLERCGFFYVLRAR